MPDLRQRSNQKELLDRDDIPFPDIRQNMRELDFINHRLGGHAITRKGFSALLQRRSQRDRLHVVEIGCGGGDNLRVLRDAARNMDLDVRLTGIDLNPECIRYAQSGSENRGIEFIRSDYREVAFESRPDIIFSSLFCHHFTDEDLRFMLRWMQGNSRLGFFINDLHRHILAYHSIRLLTRLFSRSYLVRHDAPLSVQRGFLRREWKSLFKSAGLEPQRLQWCWAFRWLIVYHHE